MRHHSAVTSSSWHATGGAGPQARADLGAGRLEARVEDEIVDGREAAGLR